MKMFAAIAGALLIGCSAEVSTTQNESSSSSQELRTRQLTLVFNDRATSQIKLDLAPAGAPDARPVRATFSSGQSSQYMLWCSAHFHTGDWPLASGHWDEDEQVLFCGEAEATVPGEARHDVRIYKFANGLFRVWATEPDGTVVPPADPARDPSTYYGQLTAVGGVGGAQDPFVLLRDTADVLTNALVGWDPVAPDPRELYEVHKVTFDLLGNFDVQIWSFGRLSILNTTGQRTSGFANVATIQSRYQAGL
jgi:hypothetical protein